MSNFIDLNKNMNDVLDKIFNNQNLCKYIYYNDDNPLSMPDIGNTRVLLTDKINQKIYTSPFVPDPDDEQKTVLCVVFDNFKRAGDNVYFKPMNIHFMIYTHIFLWHLDLGDSKVNTRVFSIMNELDKLFNLQRTIGLGKNIFDYAKVIEGNSKYYGYVLSISAIDFS